jgi:uncharacterized delta-60 repeat protein
MSTSPIRAPLIAVFAAAALLAVSAHAASSDSGPSGHAPAAAVTIGLDPGFGTHGRVLTALAPRETTWVERTVRMARAGDGDLVLADSHNVVRYLPGGSPDASFGNGGAATLPVPEGDDFALAGIAIDAQGRVILAGTLEFASQPTYVPEGVVSPVSPAQAALVRLLPDGRPDPTFGRGGLLVTDLGLPGAVYPTYAPSGPVSGPPSLTATGLALDPSGRIVLTGTFFAAVVRCRDYENAPVSNGFLARLGPDGAPDPGFAGGGPRIDAGLAWIGAPLLDRRGRVLYSGRRLKACESAGPGGVGRLDPAGNPDRSFDRDGWKSLAPDGAPRVLALDRRSRIVALSSGPLRLTATGALDPTFSGDGYAATQVPGNRSWFSTLVVDRRGGVLCAGVRVRPHRFSSFMARRYTESGKLVRGFGDAGLLETRFGANSTAGATQALLAGPGQLVLAGPAASPAMSTGQGLAIARYRARASSQ